MKRVLLIAIIALVAMANSAWGSVTVNGHTFIAIPDGSWHGGEEFYMAEPNRIAEYQGHELEIVNLYTKCKDNIACQQDSDRGIGYGMKVNALFVDGKFLAMGEASFYDDIMIDANENMLIVYSQAGHWLKIYNRDFELILERKYDMEYRLHARIIEDGNTVLVKESSHSMRQAFIITSTGRHLQLPMMLVNQGEYGGKKNVSMNDFLYIEQVMHRAFFDEERMTLYFGHTYSTGYYGFRRGVRTSTIESWDFRNGTHQTYFVDQLVKVSWEVTEQGLKYWAATQEGALILWKEYLEGEFTGRYLYVDNHMHPIFGKESATVAIMKGNYNIVHQIEMAYDVVVEKTTSTSSSTFLGLISLSSEEKRTLAFFTFLRR